MNVSTIGIKIADGSFYSILSGDGGGSKRLVLTTVRDNQSSVQIDLYKGQGNTLENARYIGSLMIENIEPAEKGSPDVELIIGVDKDGNLNATAADQVTGEKQSLSVSLTAFDESDMYDMPDFEIENDIGAVSPEEESRLTTEDYEEDENDWEEEEDENEEEIEHKAKKKHPFLLLGFILLALAVIVVLALLLFRNLRGPEVPPLEAGNGGAVEMTAEKPMEEPVITEVPKAVEAAPDKPAPVPQETPEPPEPVTPPPKLGGAWYRIAWGDTLWDISYAFYKTPWLYPVIAKENKIRNPDYILAETSIFIPAR